MNVAFSQPMFVVAVLAAASCASSVDPANDAGNSALNDANPDGAVDGDVVDAHGHAPPDATQDVAVGDTVLAPPMGACNGVSLLTNCSFEEPAATIGGLQVFANGQQFDGWTVVGAVGNVNTINTTFTQNGFLFPAEDGQQSLDLTGFSDTATGVAQAVPTVVATVYELAFWVGNVVDPQGIFGVTSTVLVQINGTTAYIATNSNGAGTTTLQWEESAFTFTATSSLTTVAFINADSSNDTSNFVDNVTLAPLQ